jgi:hypothetical protein
MPHSADANGPYMGLAGVPMPFDGGNSPAGHFLEK